MGERALVDSSPVGGAGPRGEGDGLTAAVGQRLRLADELRGVLECEGVVLESVLSLDAESVVLVLVYQVNLLATEPLREPLRVVKFSQKQHAVPRAEWLKLATPQHYRHNFADKEGIHDEQEATHQEDVRQYLARHGSVPIGGRASGHVSGQVTYALNHFWMYCTSVKPSTDYELSQIAARFSAECATIIRAPSEFARELGAAAARHSANLDVMLTPLDEVLAHVAQLHRIGTVVSVHHGPVLYTDDLKRLVGSFRHRAIPVAFTKRREFEWESEYRFTVQVRGAPTTEELYLPVSEELRNLTHIGREFSRG